MPKAKRWKPPPNPPAAISPFSRSASAMKPVPPFPARVGAGVQQFKGSAVKTRLMSETLPRLPTLPVALRPLGTAGGAHRARCDLSPLPHIAAKDQQEQIENRYQERYQALPHSALLCLLAAASFSGRFKGNRTRTARFCNNSRRNHCFVDHFGWPCANGCNVRSIPESSATNRPPVVVAPVAPVRAKQALLLPKDAIQERRKPFSPPRAARTQEAEEYRYNAAYAVYAPGHDQRGADPAPVARLAQERCARGRVARPDSDGTGECRRCGRRSRKPRLKHWKEPLSPFNVRCATRRRTSVVTAI